MESLQLRHRVVSANIAQVLQQHSPCKKLLALVVHTNMKKKKFLVNLAKLVTIVHSSMTYQL